MTTIDQRVLVPVAQSIVWDYIRNINNNPSWQTDCRSISFLSSKHEGPGTRWRYTTTKGRENVVEITAWYNGLGYEYVFVDGPRFRNNRGRIRLQEIAEGTIVQWTFSFEGGGVFSG
ncbi:MAG TPA: SRPBCC family protein, partial [Oceanobacillus sp.]|nr:SRPBCC family protein [Oceanobacillus sp.]